VDVQSTVSVVSNLQVGEVVDCDNASVPADVHLMPGIPLSGRVSLQRGRVKMANLSRGSVLFAPSINTLVKTPFGMISIAAKSIVLVMCYSGGIAIFDLHDTHADDVKIQIGFDKISLAPGRAAVMSQLPVASLEQCNPAQALPYRHIQRSEVGEKITAFTSEFSLMHACQAVQPVKQLILSSKPKARRISSSLLKTAGILGELSAGHEQFKILAKPAVVAQN